MPGVHFIVQLGAAHDLVNEIMQLASRSRQAIRLYRDRKLGLST